MSPASSHNLPGQHGPDPRELVDRLVDGTLDGASQTRLAHDMERDDRLRREAQELERVNTRLRAFFSASETGAGPALPISANGSWASRRGVIGLIAACLVVGGIVLGVVFSGPGGWAGEARALYRAIEAKSFKPQVVCTTPQEFAGWTDSNLGEALTPQVGVPGLELLGWDRAETFSPYTGVLIAKVDGRGVIVLLDREAPRAGEGAVELGGGLRAFPVSIGSIGAVEVTPFDAPRVVTTIAPAPK